MRSPRLTGVLLAVPLLLAACGGDDGGTAAGAGGSTEGNVMAGDVDEGIDGVQLVRVPENLHTEGVVDYGLEPPAGGSHNQVWLNCGFYDEPVADEHLVHDLEHGAVWLAYSPELAPSDVQVLHDLARGNDKVVATPYPSLPATTAVVATAWARQLTLDSVDDPRLAEFIDQYIDGSQAPEAGVTCGSSSLGEPIP